MSWVLLGEISLNDGVGLQRISGRRQRAVGALLALSAPDAVSTEQLIDELWPDDPPVGARNSVQRFVSDLRRSLGTDAAQLETAAGGYRLATDAIDLRRAERLVDDARTALRRGEQANAVEMFDQALAMWNGRPLAGIGSPHFAVGACASIDELRLQAIEESCALRLELGEYRKVLTDLEPVASANPHRERIWIHLAEAQRRAGLRRESAATLRTFRANLADVGLDPTSTVLELERALFAEEPEPSTPDRSAVSGRTPTNDMSTFGLNAPLPVVLERTLGSPLIGRDNVLDDLRSRLEGARRGNPELVFMSGDPGLGKTRLASELAATAHAAGWSVLYGRSSEALSVSYEAWIDTLSEIVRQAPDELIQEHVEARGTALFSLLPRLGRRACDATPDAEADSETVRLRIFDAVADLLNRWAESHPTVVILDDLQWATPTSCALLNHLGDRLTGSVFVLASFRDGEVASDGPLRSAMTSTATGREHAHLELDGLTKADISLLIEEHGPDIGDPSPTQMLERTGGNPLFVVELLRDRAEREQPNSEIPTTIQRVIERRAARLGETAVQVLRAAAVRGRVFSIEQLRAMTGRDIDEVLDVLDAATASKLVTELDGIDEVFAFTHDLVPATLVAGLSTARRQRLHVAAADAIESAGGRSTSQISDVAQHLSRAGNSADRARVRAACLAAARDAAGRFAATESCEWYDAALERTDDDTVAARTWVERAVQQRLAGDVEYREWLARAGDVARSVGADDLLIDAACADPGPTAASIYVDPAERRERIQAALDVCPPNDSIQRANLLASLATLLFGPEHRDERIGLREEAVDVARRLGDPTTLANALLRKARSAADPLSLREQSILNDEVAEILDRPNVDEPVLDFDLVRSRLAVAYTVGDGTACATLVDQAVERADRLPIPVNKLGALHCQTLQASVHADLPRFEQLNNDAFVFGSSLGVEEAAGIFQTHLIYLWSMQGKNTDVAPLIEAWAAEEPDSNPRQSAAAYVFAEAGRLEQARALVNAAAADGFVVPDTAQRVQTLNSWGLSAWLVGDEHAAASVYEQLLPDRELMATYVNHVIQPAAMTVMNLAVRLRRWDEALDHYELACRRSDELDARWMRMAADQSLAELLIRRNEHGDADRARSIATTVVAASAEHSYAGLTQRAHHVLSTEAVGDDAGLPGEVYRAALDA